MILLVDNYDSFSGNLLDYLRQSGAEVIVKQNDMLDENEALQPYKGIVLSPGPGRPEGAGKLMELLARAVDAQVPTLGICLGHQAIGMHFGARLVKGPAPVHGKTAFVYKQKSDPLLEGLSQPFEVMRYHSLIVDSIEETPLEVTGSTEDGIAMTIRHPELPMNGFQFHPESIGTPAGLQLIQNWLKSLDAAVFQ